MRIGLRMMAILVATTAAGCGAGSAADDAETAQAVGDALASLDEATETGGSAFRLKRRELRNGTIFERAVETVVPSAYAATCGTVRFGQCTAGARTKSFDACVWGPAKYDGTVTLTFSEQGCTLADTGASVTRTADFTISGRADSAFTVSSPGGGQKLTRAAEGFTYEVLGLQRKLEVGARTLFDISVKTTAPVSVTGLARATRVADGGTFEITHAQAGTTTTVSPKQLTWYGTCNCPVSGSVEGTITGRRGRSADFKLDVTGCGLATVTVDGETQALELDRCGAL